MQKYKDDLGLLDRVNMLPSPKQIDITETLLDRIEEARQQIDDVKEDISFLQTEKKDLDLISENLSKIRRLTHEKHRYPDCESIVNIFNARVGTLLKVNEHLTKKRFKGCSLFENNIIELKSCPTVNLCLENTKMPEIEGIESDDIQATLVSLDEASRVINQQYKRIDSTLQNILDYYHQLKDEFDVLILAQSRLHPVD
jgi:hypothetical protein